MSDVALLCNSHNYTLLKSDVTRRDHVVRCRGSQECWVHALSISLSISFATAQSSHNSEIYNIGVHAQYSNA